MGLEHKIEDRDFEELLQSTISNTKNFEGFLTKGKIICLNGENVIIDAGLKAEGNVPLSVLKEYSSQKEFKVGDEIDVFIDRMEDEHGNIVFSIEKAFKEKIWRKLEKAMHDKQSIEGFIVSHVKAGFAVNIDGIIAFLPKSQIDIRPIKELEEMMNKSQLFKVLKMDRQRSNVVVSRRAVIEEERVSIKSQFIEDLEEGQVVPGIVKNITDYGAFVDLGGIDGLLHVIDISWKRIIHPSDFLKIGDTIQVKIIRFNKETGRISLGMKQLEKDPWIEMKDKIKIEDMLEGEVTNITDYGAFVEIFPGIEGLIYITELSWIQKNVHPINFVKQSQKVKVKVMDVDIEKRRISLSYKRCLKNPWEAFGEQNPVGSIIDGKIRNITEFGLFVSLNEELDGMVHLTDDQESGENGKKFEVNQVIKVKILDINPEKERISLGLYKNEAE